MLRPCAAFGNVATLLTRGGRAQIGRAKHLSFSGTLPHPPPPAASLAPGSATYKAQVDDVLDVQAKLTDVQKMQVCPRLHCTRPLP